ncbi:predicted protein [Histoplasma capsulatum G186AR]|uniref:Uncharacterized protein n=1 Tax=Ajellomyces capsulatus (strain G186AR / H82 / ATCC MYA-2454 / RMSCC 2432) TaxID=447093 RepID=C0NPD6_AJECG|nr:uncharacterized protein HCBG_05016 [Histoplasma capsulatum G186AR]EEH06796.1 predicted protein [Histoplasma capsulatum G186AR]
MGLLGGTSSSLKSFVRILEEEEAEMLGREGRERAGLVKWSQASGAMWLHMLLSSGLNGYCAASLLRSSFGETRNDKGLLRKVGSVRPIPFFLHFYVAWKRLGPIRKEV